MALSERWHVLGDGGGVVQRELYSAFLAPQDQPGPLSEDIVHPSQAFGTLAQAWVAAHSLLRRAGWARNQCASVESLLSTAQAASMLPAPRARTHRASKGIGVGSRPRGSIARRPRQVQP